ncbi:calcineurin-like phosphoesterase family protein [Mumia flava]|uniref:Calcineurin-like phosphoesterase family protein n=1 Tax=Mumia flava TaxID=1348852 RepID=A0A2M9BJT5_9ACTN|nr:LamG-like jellyroll fold domain-containing protein [Mumia flava]PJJ58209.1 calcineurin-like phosphoesterase family protein [Mumia flava]
MLRRLSSLAAAAAVGLGSLTAISAAPARAADLPVADVLDVDFRDGTTTDTARGVEPDVHGEPTATADLTIGRPAWAFDGTDDALAYDLSDQYESLSGAMTLECSFRFDDQRTPSSPEGDACSNKEGGGFGTVMSGTDIVFMIHVGGGYKSVRVQAETGRWYHTAAVWDGSTVTLYVDGEQAAQTPATGAFKPAGGSATSLFLGADSNGSNQPSFYGQATLRTARIYSDALDATQAAALAESDQAAPTAPSADIVDVDFADGTPTDHAQGLPAETWGEPVISEHTPLGKQVAAFDGSSAFTYPMDGQYDKLQGGFSVECVFKYDDDLPPSGETRGNLCANKEAGGFSITLYGDRLSFNPNIGGTYRNTNTQVTDGRWYHAVGTWDGSTATLYLDGVPVAQSATTGSLTLPSDGAHFFAVGADSARNRPQFYAPATISTARIFGHALTPSEVLALGREAIGQHRSARPVELTSSVPAAGERLRRAVTFQAAFENGEALSRDVTYTLDDEPIEPGERIGAGLASGDHLIAITGTDVFGAPVDIEIPFTSGNIPSGGGTETGQGEGTVTLSAIATNPSGGDVTTTFTSADVVVADSGTQGVVDDLPTTLDFAADDPTAITEPLQPDDAYLDSPTTNALPFQRFDVPVSAGRGQRIVWTGALDPSRSAVLRLWDGEQWEEMGDIRGSADADVSLSADVSPRHVHEGVVPVMVTGEDPFADDLLNEVRDAFEDPADYDFSIAHLTDTQYLSEGAVEQETPTERALWQRAYTDTTQWIADHAAERKIAFAAHTGDVIENYHNAPASDAYKANARLEYEVASAAQKIVDDAGVVNAVIPGNHDNLYGVDTGPEAMYNDYFGPERYEALAQTPTWQAAQAEFHPWQPGDASNGYTLFSAGGLDFIALQLAFGVTVEETVWADEVLEQYADRNAIMLTHAYTTPSVNPDGRGAGWSYDGKRVFDQVVKKNENVFLVLSGHEHGVDIEVRRNVGTRGNHVVDLLADYQFYEVTAEELGLTEVGGYAPDAGLRFGSSFFRMLQFDVDAGEMAVDTFSPLLENFGATEYDDRLRYDGTEDDTRLPVQLETRRTSFSTNGLVVVDPTDEVIGTATARSGWPASVTWSGLEAGTTYAWYATSADATSGEELEAGEVGQIAMFTASNAGTDTTPPEIVVPEDTTVELGDEFDPLAGVTATDAVDGDVLASVVVVGSVDTTKPGSYALSYTATDANGNQAIASRVVEVAQAPAPVNVRRPRITGRAVVGGDLAVDAGEWRNVDAAELTVRWLRDGRTIPGAKGAAYRPVAADAGTRISARVAAKVPGRSAVSATSRAVRIAKIASRTSVRVAPKQLGARQRARAIVTVRAPRMRATGTVRVAVDGRVVRTARLDRRGKAVVTLPRQRPGRHRVVVTYRGSDALTASRGVARVVVRR